ncbi:uncharacterized protein LOC127854708 [Dreissena polymorpha]|uniref:uncharacterized protein LOC127854708 n=1 Tax=Dreissena polymorpha TaxID=45954 RepID=UPI0022642DD4|nr:uncharacterized protein LOC127854708 [Dreissena polymorpha]
MSTPLAWFTYNEWRMDAYQIRSCATLPLAQFQDNARNTEADFYCEECSRFYCSKCVEHHNYLYKKHALLDKKNISQWPETDESGQEICQEHKKEKLTGFCEDHSQLICHACHVHNHQKCSKVVLIADKIKDLHQKGGFKQLTATIDTQHQQLIRKKDDLEENMKSIEKSYNNILEEINSLRKAINDSLDQLEKNTKKKLDALLATMRTSIQTDIENCMECINNITCLKEGWLRSEEKSQALSLFKYSKCLDQSFKVDAVLQEMTIKIEKTLTFNPDTTIQQTQPTLTGLGKILSTVRQSQLAENKTQNTVTTPNKPKASSQSDPGNQTEDLTKSGQVSDPISSSLQQTILGYQPGAAIKSDKIIKVKSSKKYSVNFKGDKGKCVINDICETASGELLIADFYNEKVKLLDQTYKVVAHYKLDYGPWSLCSIDTNLVAVSMNNREVIFIRVTNDGDRIYVTNEDSYQLVTLSRDGKLISTLTDAALNHEIQLPSLNVTDSGQVFVCGDWFPTIIQVDRDGSQILDEVITKDDGVTDPTAVYYSKKKSSIIVGMYWNNDIMVFEAQWQLKKDNVRS